MAHTSLIPTIKPILLSFSRCRLSSVFCVIFFTLFTISFSHNSNKDENFIKRCRKQMTPYNLLSYFSDSVSLHHPTPRHARVSSTYFNTLVVFHILTKDYRYYFYDYSALNYTEPYTLLNARNV